MKEDAKEAKEKAKMEQENAIRKRNTVIYIFKKKRGQKGEKE